VQKLVRPYLEDILDAISGIDETTAGLSFKTYEQVWSVRRSVERGVEIISEASKHIPEELRQTQPQIPWKRIIGIGNVLRHDYRQVVDRVMYDVTGDDLVALKAAVLAILANLDEPEE
jgi:uncharacterized protein with HEPN domain